MSRVDDLQTWLALEHEAVWLYGVIGGRFAALEAAARTSYDAHRAVRDRLATLIRASGGRPEGPSLGYGDVGFDGRARAREAAADVEHRIAAACVTAVGSTTGDDRALAVTGLRRAALAALDWGAEPQAFPGLD